VTWVVKMLIATCCPHVRTEKCEVTLRAKGSILIGPRPCSWYGRSVAGVGMCDAALLFLQILDVFR